MLNLLALLACTPAPPAIDEDLDGDGVSGAADCDDDDATRHPGADDVLGDDVDQNCDGLDGVDADGDGYAAQEGGGDDCDDTRADTHPGAAETWYDGVNQDCVGDSDHDADGDGHDAFSGGGDDCDDADWSIRPGVAEYCDGVDEDCDGNVDEDALDALRVYEDLDADGFGGGASIDVCAISDGQFETRDDCDDGDPTVHPGADDPCGDGIDGDCVPNSPTCGLWEDVDASAAAATFSGTVASASVGSSLGGGQDLTGDGAMDVLIGVDEAANGDTVLAIFAGPFPASGTVDAADARIVQASMEDATGRGETTAAVTADLTGDGEPDVFLGSPYAGDRYDGLANIFSGPFTGDRSSDAPDIAVVPLESGHQQLGRYFAAPGDLTGDGLDDFAVTSEHVATETWIFAGPLVGSVTTADAVGHLVGRWPDTDVHDLGDHLVGGDVDGDGVGDLIANTEDDLALLFLGPFVGERTDEAADVRFEGELRSSLGCRTSVSADQDADGYPEVTMGACGSAVEGVYLFDGPLPGVVAATDAEANIEPDDSDDGLGNALASLDLDGDGAADLAVGALGRDTDHEGADEGNLMVFYGPLRGTIALLDADVALRGDAEDQYFGCGTAPAGDVDADGFPDLLVGAGCGRVEAPGFATLWFGGPGE